MELNPWQVSRFKFRPPPSHREDGLVWAMRPAGTLWELVGRHSSQRCRFVGGRPRAQCPNPPVVRLLRPRYRARYESSTWWPYCLDHAYGRFVWQGVVHEWFLTEAAQPLVCAGRKVTEETLQPYGPACGRTLNPAQQTYVDAVTRATVLVRPESADEMAARARSGRGWSVPAGHPELAMCDRCRGSVGT